MLQNRIYRGEIVHQGAAYPGQHEAIVDPELWQIVQDKLAANRHERSLAAGAEAPSLLAGLIVDADGERMTPTHATKRAKRYRYYVSASLLAGDRPGKPRTGCASRRATSKDLCSIGCGDFSRPGRMSALRSRRSISTHAVLTRPCANRPSFPSDGSPCRRSRSQPRPGDCRKDAVAADGITLHLSAAKLAAALTGGGRADRADADPIVLSIEAKLKRAGKGKRLIIENGAGAEVNEGLVALIREAFAIRNQLLSGPDDSIEAMSGRLGMNKGRLTSLVRLILSRAGHCARSCSRAVIRSS